MDSIEQRAALGITKMVGLNPRPVEVAPTQNPWTAWKTAPATGFTPEEGALFAAKCRQLQEEIR